MRTGPWISSIALMQARVLTPSMFIAQEPHTPSRQERRKVKVVSISFFILISASSTIGPQSARSIEYVSTVGLWPLSAFHRWTWNRGGRCAFDGGGYVVPVPILEFLGRLNSAIYRPMVIALGAGVAGALVAIYQAGLWLRGSV